MIDTDSDDGAWQREMERTRKYQPMRMRPVWEVEGEGEKVTKPTDDITRPAHYRVAGKEAWEIIEDVIKGMHPVTAYHVASALKYLLRCGRKHITPDVDIGKADQHLQRVLRGKRDSAYEDGAA